MDLSEQSESFGKKGRRLELCNPSSNWNHPIRNRPWLPNLIFQWSCGQKNAVLPLLIFLVRELV